MTEKINRTDELLEMVLENQVTEIGYLKSI
jgi:hypothetical protein